MAKYQVEGLIRVKMTVEADSEDEALEMAEENFEFDKHVDAEALPEWEVANELEPELEDEDDDVPFRSGARSRFDNEDEDDD